MAVKTSASMDKRKFKRHKPIVTKRKSVVKEYKKYKKHITKPSVGKATEDEISTRELPEERGEVKLTNLIVSDDEKENIYGFDLGEIKRFKGDVTKTYKYSAITPYTNVVNFHKDFKELEEKMLKEEVFMRPIKPMKVLHSIPVLFYDKRDKEYEIYWYRDDHKKCSIDIRYHNNMSNFEENYMLFEEHFAKYIEEKEMESSMKVFVSTGAAHITLARYNVRKGGSYLELPFQSHTLINPKNKDNRCSLYSLLAYFLYVKCKPKKVKDEERNKLYKHMERVKQYQIFEILLKEDINDIKQYRSGGKTLPNGLSKVQTEKIFKLLTDEQIAEIKTLLPKLDMEFPTTVDKGFDEFTAANKDIAINVYELERNDEGLLIEDEKDLRREHFTVVPLRNKAAHLNRKFKINLLFIQRCTGKECKEHYCLITDFDAFNTGNDKNRNHLITCERCCSYTTTSKDDYQKHIESSGNNAPCKVLLPTEGNKKWKFENYEFIASPLACGYADFEANNTALVEDIGADVEHQRMEVEQNPNSYGLLITSTNQNILKDEFTIEHAKTDDKEEIVQLFVDKCEKLNYLLMNPPAQKHNESLADAAKRFAKRKIKLKDLESNKIYCIIQATKKCFSVKGSLYEYFKVEITPRTYDEFLKDASSKDDLLRDASTNDFLQIKILCNLYPNLTRDKLMCSNLLKREDKDELDFIPKAGQFFRGLLYTNAPMKPLTKHQQKIQSKAKCCYMCKRKSVSAKEVDDEYEVKLTKIEERIQTAREENKTKTEIAEKRSFILSIEQHAAILKTINLKNKRKTRKILKLELSESAYKREGNSTYPLPVNKIEAKKYDKGEAMTYTLSQQKLSYIQKTDTGWEVSNKEFIDGQETSEMINNIKCSGVVLVRHHDHYTGEYISALCFDCNYKEGLKTKFLPLFFHNLSGYDGHAIFLKLAERESEFMKLDKIIAKTKDVYISFTFGCIRFLDSLRFLVSSLDGVAKALDDEDFVHTKKWLPKSAVNDVETLHLLRQKGIYPYDWITSCEQFKETKLPPKEAFYSRLRDEGVTDKEYEQAKYIWKTFKSKTFQDYHELYLRTDVLLLAEAFEKYRKFFRQQHVIDPVHCYSAPGLTENCGKRYAGDIWNGAYDVIFEKDNFVLSNMRDMHYFRYIKNVTDKVVIPNYMRIKRIHKLLNLTKDRFEIYLRDEKGMTSLQILGKKLLDDDPNLNMSILTKNLDESKSKLKVKLAELCKDKVNIANIKIGADIYSEYNSLLDHALHIDLELCNKLDVLMMRIRKNWQIIEKVNEIVMLEDDEDLTKIKSNQRSDYDFAVELLTDSEMLTMAEDGVREGYSGLLGDRYVKANNKFLPDYNPDKPPSFLQYIDANNLYGWSMMQKMPYNDFNWLSHEDYKMLEKKKIEGNKLAIKFLKTHSFIWKVDLIYTKRAKLKTWKYPLAPVTKKANNNNSKWQYEYKMENHVPTTEKLMLDCHDRENYVVHDRALQLYKKHGMKVAKVHKIIVFREVSWLKPYIEFNTAQRTIASTDFEKDIYKLMNNAFFGKTCENVRKRSDVTIETDAEEVMRLHRRSNYMSEIIFTADITAVQMRKTSLKFNKPIIVGMVVLDEAKRCMYEIFYDRVLKTWPNAEVLGGDTDSLVLYIETEDLYQDMKNHMEEFDLSEYPADNSEYFKLKTEEEKTNYKEKYCHLFTKWDETEKCFLHSEDNKKIPGLPKDEELGYLINEFVYLRAKNYWYSVLGKMDEKKRCKGVGKCAVKNKISGKDYKAAIGIDVKMPKSHSVNMLQIRSEKHKIFIMNLRKKALDVYDDKRYICEDLITTFPAGIENVIEDIIAKENVALHKREKLYEMLYDVYGSLEMLFQQ